MNANQSSVTRSYWDVRPSDGVSVVIAHYGDPALTAQLVVDLRAQVFDGRIEIIVSDDASPVPFPATDGIVVTRSERNGGFGTAINRGAVLATRHWLLILNSDARLTANFVADFTVRAQQFQPAICGVRQRSSVGYEPAYRSSPRILTTVTAHVGLLAAMQRRLPDRWPVENSDPQADTTGSVDWLVGSALLLPKLLFETVGGFDERYFMYVEEVDLQRRIHLLGIPSILIADLEIGHDAGRSSSGLDASVEMLRSRLIYEEKWYGQSRRQFLRGLLAIGIVMDGAADHARRVVGKPAEEPGYERRRLSVLTEAAKPRRRSP
ncbi:MAG: glycosyltransferase family 2 protein [Actinomycetes bacterium]